MSRYRYRAVGGSGAQLTTVKSPGSAKTNFAGCAIYRSGKSQRKGRIAEDPKAIRKGERDL